MLCACAGLLSPQRKIWTWSSLQGTQLAYSNLVSSSEQAAAVPGITQLPHKTLLDFTIGQAGAPELLEPWLPRVRSLINHSIDIDQSRVVSQHEDKQSHISQSQ